MRASEPAIASQDRAFRFSTIPCFPFFTGRSCGSCGLAACHGLEIVARDPLRQRMILRRLFSSLFLKFCSFYMRLDFRMFMGGTCRCRMLIARMKVFRQWREFVFDNFLFEFRGILLLTGFSTMKICTGRNGGEGILENFQIRISR